LIVELSCISIACSLLLKGGWYPAFKSKDTAVFSDNKSMIQCSKTPDGYNCNPVNNMFNPIGN